MFCRGGVYPRPAITFFGRPMKKIFFIAVSLVVILIQTSIRAECQIGAFFPSTINGQLFSVNDINGYANLTGRKPALVLAFITIGDDFPVFDCNRAYQAGCVPMLSWKLQTGKGTNTLQDIINGGQDSIIKQFAQQVKAFNRDIILRPAWEMNLKTDFDWTGYNNGSSNTAYGNPALYDGPERYILVFRHIWTIFNQAGVKNVRWVWCPNNESKPTNAWNAAVNYYPGDQYVDWIGIDGYNFGNPWRSFDATYSNIYMSVTAISHRPVMIGEFSCSSIEITNDTTNQNMDSQKAVWITDAFLKIKNRYTTIKAFFWLNVNKTGVNEWERDWRVDSGSLSLSAFRQSISDPYFWSYGSSDVYGTRLAPVNEDNLEIHVGPNYFKPDKTPLLNIFYRVKNKTTLSVKIFNANGKIIRTIMDHMTVAGSDSPFYASWNGKDSKEMAVKSGLYFVDFIEGAENHKIEKIILIR